MFVTKIIKAGIAQVSALSKTILPDHLPMIEDVVVSLLMAELLILFGVTIVVFSIHNDYEEGCFGIARYTELLKIM